MIQIDVTTDHPRNVYGFVDPKYGAITIKGEGTTPKNPDHSLKNFQKKVEKTKSIYDNEEKKKTTFAKNARLKFNPKMFDILMAKREKFKRDKESILPKGEKKQIKTIFSPKERELYDVEARMKTLSIEAKEKIKKKKRDKRNRKRAKQKKKTKETFTYKTNEGWNLEYVGEKKNGIPHGKGKLYTAKKKELLHDGVFDNGVPHGHGVKYHPGGKKVYEGNFVKGLEGGKGKLFYENVDDANVTGVFKNGRIIFGRLVVEGSLAYEGGYKDGVFHGRGKRFSNGNMVYSGEFKNGVRNGKGKEYVLDSGKNVVVYDGEFKNNKRHGFGIEFNNTEPHGYVKYYVGDWKYGMWDGQGELWDGPQLVYRGGVKRNELHGYVDVFSEDGKESETVLFRNGEPIGK